MMNGRQIVKMEFGLKALQFLNAKTEPKIKDAIVFSQIIKKI